MVGLVFRMSRVQLFNSQLSGCPEWLWASCSGSLMHSCLPSHTVWSVFCNCNLVYCCCLMILVAGVLPSNYCITAVTSRYFSLQQSTAPQAGYARLTQVWSMGSWTLSRVSFLPPSVLHLSHGFQCSPTLNRQPYKGRLPLTSWWKKSSNTTVGQSSLIFLTHQCYDWHPGSRCGWTCNQLTSQVDGGVTRSRLRWSTLT